MNIVVVAGVVISLLTAIPVFAQMRRHPEGLHVLFFAEMWERFSYYGMRGLLIFYLTQHFLFDDRFSQGQYGAYTSLVYLTPLIGGLVADRYIGTRKATAFGALLVVAGHLAMAAEGPPATEALVHDGARYEFVVEGRGNDRQVFLDVEGAHYRFGADSTGALVVEGLPADAPIPAILPAGSFSTEIVQRDGFYVGVFYLALALIVMGVGFLKPNISAIVGQLYTENDPRRDPGFTLYYYGINLGAFWASILCGLLGQTVGWWAGFGLAGIGMALGWLVFVRGRFLFFLPGPSLIAHVGGPPEGVDVARKVGGAIRLDWLIYLGALAGVAAVWLLLQRQEWVGGLLAAGSLMVLAYMGWFMIARLDRVQRDRLLLALILIAASVAFWTLFEQAGSSMNQFADRNTQLPNEGFLLITPAQTQSFNSGFILIFAPVFSALWAFLGARGLDPNTPLKFALALVQVGAGFLVLAWGVHFADDSYRVPLIFLAAAYLLHTTGELCLSPVGLSMVTKLSTAAIVSTVMAVWFLSSAWAQYLGGMVAQLTAAETVAGQVLDPARALSVYMDVFGQIGLWGIGLGVLLGLVSFRLKRLGHGAAGALRPTPQMQEAGEPAPQRLQDDPRQRF